MSLINMTEAGLMLNTLDRWLGAESPLYTEPIVTPTLTDRPNT